MNIQRPVYFSINDALVDTTYCYQVELVLVTNQKGIRTYLLQKS